jgi:CheY-like chemotaxis protein
MSAESALIVNEHPEAAEVIRDCLREAGLRNIDLASDPQRAVMKVVERCYALAIVDADVPSPDGSSLIKTLRAARGDAPTRYILVSGKTDAATVLAAKEDDVSGFLAKPYSLLQLKRAVSRALGEVCC